MNRAFERVRQRPAPDLWPEIERRIERRPATPQPVRQRLLAAVVAFVVAAGAITGLWLGFRPGTQPAKPSIRVVGDPVDLEAGEGWLWLLTCTKCSDNAVGSGTAEGDLVRIDPMTGRPEKSVRVRNPSALAVGEGGVWIANFGADTVTRIDPRTLRVMATINLMVRGAVAPGDRLRFLPLYIHVGQGAVWVDTARGALVRIDPTTDRSVGYTDLPPEATGDFVVGDQDIWVTVGLSGVYRVNQTSGAVTARIAIGSKRRRLAVQSVAVGGGRVAVAGRWSKGTVYPDGHVEYGPSQGASVAFIDPATNRVQETVSIPDWSGYVVFLQGAFWVTRNNGAVLSQLGTDRNSSRGQIISDSYLRSGMHFFAGGQVWTLEADGSLVRSLIAKVALPTR